MMQKSMVGLAILVTFQLASAEDFKKSYSLIAATPNSPGSFITPGGPVPGRHMFPRGPMHGEPPLGMPIMPAWPQILIKIENIKGNLKVVGYSGKSIEITAKKGPNSDPIQIIDQSDGNHIDLSIRPPLFDVNSYSIECEVRVPDSEYIFFLRNSFGNIDISNLEGRLFARSEFGEIQIKDIRGEVRASTINGKFTVEIGPEQKNNVTILHSSSGNINVLAPVNFDATIEIKSTSGFLKTDFPIIIQKARYGPAQFVHQAKLGTGKQTLEISSEQGHISLMQKK
jgi:hypothetical protein